MKYELLLFFSPLKSYFSCWWNKCNFFQDFQHYHICPCLRYAISAIKTSFGTPKCPKTNFFTWEWYLTCIYTFLNQFWLIWMTIWFQAEFALQRRTVFLLLLLYPFSQLRNDDIANSDILPNNFGISFVAGIATIHLKKNSIVILGRLLEVIFFGSNGNVAGIDGVHHEAIDGNI